jgi:hypothetical protein
MEVKVEMVNMQRRAFGDPLLLWSVLGELRRLVEEALNTNVGKTWLFSSVCSTTVHPLLACVIHACCSKDQHGYAEADANTKSNVVRSGAVGVLL